MDSDSVREVWEVRGRYRDSVHPYLIVGHGGRYVAEIDTTRSAHPATDGALIAGASKLFPALEQLLAWAEAANQRLDYERKDGETGFQFGGNPYANQVFKAAREALAYAIGAAGNE